MDRTFIEVINQNNEKEKIEIFAQVKSTKDDKLYILLTPDAQIEDEVNIAIATLEEKENGLYINLVENEEELNYVYDLIINALEEGEKDGRK